MERGYKPQRPAPCCGATDRGRKHGAHASRDHRRGTRGPPSLPSLASWRDRQRRARAPDQGACAHAHSRRGARIRHGQASAGVRRRRPDGPRRPCARRQLDRLAGPRAVSDRHEEAHGQADVVAWPDGDHRGTVQGAGTRRRTHRRIGGKRPAPRPDRRRAEGLLREGRRGDDDRMRFRRRLRRVSWGVAPKHSRGGGADIRARLSVRLARDHVGDAAGRRRHLCPSRARLRPDLAAQSHAEPTLHPMQSRHRDRATGRTSASGTS